MMLWHRNRPKRETGLRNVLGHTTESLELMECQVQTWLARPLKKGVYTMVEEANHRQVSFIGKVDYRETKVLI